MKGRGCQRDKQRDHSVSDTTLHYNWDVRPAYVPLERKEVAIALKIAEWDAERAADLLESQHLKTDGVPARTQRLVSASRA